MCRRWYWPVVLALTCTLGYTLTRSGFILCNEALAVEVAPSQSSTTPAAEPEYPPPDPLGGFNIQWENDAFSLGSSDAHYTNGLRFSYLTGEDKVWSCVAAAARAAPFYPSGGRLRASYALGQSIFTPEDISRTDPILDDRPYAAWLYAAVGLVADNDQILDILELSLGVVGPVAQGEEVQKWIHRVIDSPEPMGWANQLQNEFAIQLTYERKWRSLHLLDSLPLFRRLKLEWDLTPHFGAALGNVFIYGAGGASVRLGNDLPADYGPPRIRPSLPGSEFFVPTRRLGWYIFAGLEGRAVARNLFLDGNTFKESLSVVKEPFIGDMQAGLALTFSSLRFAFTYVVRTKEFKTQRKADQFGALTLSIRL